MDANEPVAGTMNTARPGFERHLDSVEARVLAMGEATKRMLVDTGLALQTLDVDRCRAVIVADDDIDAAYVDIERSIVELIARQQPVAVDLRRLMALLQTSLHLEHIADSAVEVARLVLEAEGPKPGLVADLAAMDTKVRRMLDTALHALHERRSDLCLAVVRMGDLLDDVHQSIVTGIVVEGNERTALRWLLWIDRAARLLEQAGQHAIDIAEAIWFQATAEMRDLDHNDRQAVEPRVGPRVESRAS